MRKMGFETHANDYVLCFHEYGGWMNASLVVGWLQKNPCEKFDVCGSIVTIASLLIGDCVDQMVCRSIVMIL